MREASASKPSESIAPPPTRSASVSISSCFDDEELLTRLCHPAIDRDEQDRPDRTQDPLRVVEERSRGELDRNVRKGRRERADDDQDDRGVGGVKRKIVRRLDESRGG